MSYSTIPNMANLKMVTREESKTRFAELRDLHQKNEGKTLLSSFWETSVQKNRASDCDGVQLQGELTVLRSKGRLQGKFRKVSTETEKERSREHCTEQSEHLSSPKHRSELERDIAALKTHNTALQDEIRCLKSKLKTQDDLKERCVELEAEKHRICCENKTLQAKLKGLCGKVETEKFRKECVEISEEIELENALLRSYTEKLQKLEPTKTTLLQLESLKERCFTLQAERNRIQGENRLIQKDLSEMILKITEAKSWEQKLDVMKVSKSATESENKQLKAHLKKLQKQYDKQKKTEVKLKLQFEKLDDMGRENYHLQQDVNQMTTKITNCKSAQDKLKDFTKKDSQVKAMNEQLREKVQKLKKELQKLQCGKEDENFGESLDKLRQENSTLHDKIQELNENITSTKMLKAQLKSVNAERAWLLQRNSNLSEEMFRLESVQVEQQVLREEYEKWEEENFDQMRQNEKLRVKLKYSFLKTFDAEVQNILTNALKAQHEEMFGLNHKLMEEIDQSKTKAEPTLEVMEQIEFKTKMDQTEAKTEQTLDQMEETAQSIHPAALSIAGTRGQLSDRPNHTAPSPNGSSCRWWDRRATS